MIRCRLLAILLSALLSACAVAQSMSTSRFHTQAEIRKDRTVQIKEEIEVSFLKSSFGIRRWVPVDYLGRNDERRQIELELVSVTQQSEGMASPAKANVIQTIDSGWWKLQIGQEGVPLTGKVRYEIVYRLKGALTDFDATDKAKAHTEFRWNLLPTSWATPIEKASFELSFPQGGDTPPRIRCLVGKVGSKDGVEIVSPGSKPKGRSELLDLTLTKSQATGTIKGALDAHQGAFVALAVAKGAVDWEGAYTPEKRGPGDKPQTYVGEDQDTVGAGEPTSPGLENLWNPLGLIPFGILALVALLVRKIVGVPKMGPLVTRFEPPAGMGPIEAGYLHDGSFQPRDMTAGLLSLAQKGALRIHMPLSQQGVSGDWTLELTSKNPKDLTKAESELLTALEPFGPSITAEQLKGNFLRGYQSVQKIVQHEAIYEGYMRANHGCVQGCGCLGSIFVSLVLGAFCFSLGPGWVMLGGIAGLILLAVTLLTAKTHTAKGAKVQHELKGLYEFISRAQADELKSMSAKMPLQALFESLLPYAVAFGLVEEWAKAFQGLNIGQPEWIDAGPGFSYDTFVWSTVLSDSIPQFEQSWTPALTPASLFEGKGTPSDSSWSDGTGSSFASGDSSFSDYGSSSSDSSSYDSGSSDSVGDGGGGGGGDSW